MRFAIAAGLAGLAMFLPASKIFASNGHGPTSPGAAATMPGGDRPGASTEAPGSGLATGLVPGVWKDISPPDVHFHKDGTTDVFTQGIAVDPEVPSTLYLGVDSFDMNNGGGGLYKSLDGGGSWSKIGTLDEPIRIRIDPRHHEHLYAADGVRGSTQGFWVSEDGGHSWSMPPGFKALEATLYQFDVYDVAVDPADFKHVLVTSHSSWDGFNGAFTKWGDDSGVLESKDGGNSWIVHDPAPGWSHGNGVWFLGTSQTWLVGSQAAGFWRTTDGGVHWANVSKNNMQHGGGALFKSRSGTLYAGGTPHVMRSRDDGATWTMLGPSAGFNAIIGDGTHLYTGAVGGPRWIVASESDDTSWKDYANGPMPPSGTMAGPFEMAFDARNAILYAASWDAGLWALKVR